MATTIKTFITDANSGLTESDAPYDSIASHMGTEEDCQITTTRLAGDRVFIILTKTTA